MYLSVCMYVSIANQPSLLLLLLLCASCGGKLCTGCDAWLKQLLSIDVQQQQRVVLQLLTLSCCVDICEV
jgi:hypothetical protein